MKRFLPLLSLIGFIVFAPKAQAVCPICTVAVGVGLGVSRWIGIDDSVTALWIGGLIFSSGLWMGDWIKKKGWKLPYPNILSVILMALFVIVPLYFSHIIGAPGNTLWGVDKVLLGTLLGSFIFMFGVLGDKFLRKTNGGKVYIYYQKVILPVFMLSFWSFVLYLLTK